MPLSAFMARGEADVFWEMFFTREDEETSGGTIDSDSLTVAEQPFDSDKATIWYGQDCAVVLLTMLLAQDEVRLCERHLTTTESAGECGCIDKVTSRILDVGCGNGHLSAMLAASGFEHVVSLAQ